MWGLRLRTRTPSLDLALAGGERSGSVGRSGRFESALPLACCEDVGELRRRN